MSRSDWVRNALVSGFAGSASYRLSLSVEYHGVRCVDEAGRFLVVRIHAQCGVFGDGNVQQPIRRVRSVGGVAGVGGIDRQLGIELRRVRLIVDDAYRAGDGARAVKSALRAPQHFDSLDVREIQIDEHGHFVDIGGHQRHAFPGQIRGGSGIIGVQAANDDVAVAAARARTEVRDIDAGHEARDVGQAGDLGRLQRLAGDGRDVVGDVQHVLFAPIGGHHDLFQRIGRVRGECVRCHAERHGDRRRERGVRTAYWGRQASTIGSRSRGFPHWGVEKESAGQPGLRRPRT